MKKESEVLCSSKDGSADFCLCLVKGVIEVINRKWAMQIIGVVGNHKKLRYNNILKKLKPISPKTLSDRLKDLEKANLIKREFFAEIPPKVEYSLTEDGKNLRTAIIPLMEWASKRKELGK